MYPTQVLSREFLRMVIVILSFAVPVGIHLAFLFRCLGTTTGISITPLSIPVSLCHLGREGMKKIHEGVTLSKSDYPAAYMDASTEVAYSFDD